MITPAFSITANANSHQPPTSPMLSLQQRKLQLPYSTANHLKSQLGTKMNPEIARFTAVVQSALGPGGYLEKSGATLYSAPSTLRRGSVYLLGTNPGGSDDDKDTIGASLAALPLKTTNSYLDEAWDTRPDAKGQALLQRRVKALIEDGLGLETRDVCAANLVFQRTAGIPGLNFWAAADACWPVHEHVLSVVHPRLVLAFGNSATSAYGYLDKKLRRGADLDCFPAGHGNWECRGFRTTWQDQEMYVAGIPHLSYYSPTQGGAIKPKLREWLQAALDGDAMR